MLARSIEADIERLLLQWWQARSSGTGSGGSHPMWNQAARGPRAANVVPILQGEAERTDRALRAMPEYLRDLLKEARLNISDRDRNCQHRTADAKAKARKMSRTTYWRWVQKAEAAFWDCYTRERVAPVRIEAARAAVQVDLDRPFYDGPPDEPDPFIGLERPRARKRKA